MFLAPSLKLDSLRTLPIDSARQIQWRFAGRYDLPRHPKGLSTCCHGEEPHVVGWRFINDRRAVNLDPNCGWARGKADVLYVADAFQVMENSTRCAPSAPRNSRQSRSLVALRSLRKNSVVSFRTESAE